MSFLSRIFSKNEPETLEQKVAGLEQLPQEQILSTAQGASIEDPLRVAAISRLEYSPTLVSMALDKETSTQVNSAAKKRIGELLDSEKVSVEELGKSTQDQSALLALCGYSSLAGISIVSQIDDESYLLEIASNGNTTQLRQSAAERIHSQEMLESLSKSARQKDKSVYKIVKSKLSVFKAEEAKIAELYEKIDSLCHQVEQLANREVDDIFLGRKKQLQHQWEEYLEDADDARKDRFNRAIANCQQKLDDIEAAKRAVEEQEQAEKLAKKDLHQTFVNAQELLARLFTHPSPDDLSKDIDQAEEEQKKALDEATNRGLNTDKEQLKSKQLSESLKRLKEKVATFGPIDKLLEDLKEAKDDNAERIKANVESILVHGKELKDVKIPDALDKSKQYLSEWRLLAKEKAERSKEALRETSELIRRTNWAVSNGYVGRARAIYRDLEEKVQNLDKLPTHLESKLEDVKLSMKKLGDWHEFAVTPKKEALITQMQGLIDSTLHPQDLAEKIHKLQDSWKELCKGGQNQDEDLWTKFNTASQSAYEKCKTYFDEQAQIREKNAEMRQNLITHLKEYEDNYNWEHANWKEVESTLKVARENWQGYWPIPRKQVKEMQTEFDGILDRIFNKRNEEFEQNRQKKENIVDQSKELLETEDTQAAIDKAKNLQSQWQSLGRCKRKDDQALWKSFRANCDLIFEKRNQENDAQKAERNASKEQAESILTDLKSILDKEGSEFFEAKAQSSELTEKFQQVGELPRDSAKSIHNRYHKILEDIDAKVDQEREKGNARMWIDIFSLANKLRQAESESAKGEFSAEQQEGIRESFEQIAKWPGETKTIIDARINILEGFGGDEKADSQLRTLLIQSEILQGIETPAQDKAFRMEYQVNQLQQGLGNSNETLKASRSEMLNLWLGVSGAGEQAYTDYLPRFAKCWNLELD